MNADMKCINEISDEDLFKQPPQDDCPICFVPMPLHAARAYQLCCGQFVCNGCIFGSYVSDKINTCPFCRGPTSYSNYIEKEKERAEAGDPFALYDVGGRYYAGDRGFPQSYEKALEYWFRASEQDRTSQNFIIANTNYQIADAYSRGEGIEKDEDKAIHYFKLSAIGGNVQARRRLGEWELKKGNQQRAAMHFMIGAIAGDNKSLAQVRKCYVNGSVTKDDFAKALRAHKAANDEMKSEQRDAATYYIKICNKEFVKQAKKGK